MIARALRAAPVEVTDQFGDQITSKSDGEDDSVGDGLLRALDWDRLHWVRDVLEADVGVQVSRLGVAARLHRWEDVPAPVPVGTDRHDARRDNGASQNGGPNNNGADAGAGNTTGDGGDGCVDGWVDVRVEHYTGEFPEAPDIAPFDGVTSSWDYEDEIIVGTWRRD